MGALPGGATNRCTNDAAGAVKVEEFQDEQEIGNCSGTAQNFHGIRLKTPSSSASPTSS